MGRSDLDAVSARRVALARRLEVLEVTRAALMAEHDELEVTERVLHRLADYMVAQVPEQVASAPEPSVRMGKTAWFPKANDVWGRQLSRIRGASRGLFANHTFER